MSHPQAQALEISLARNGQRGAPRTGELKSWAAAALGRKAHGAELSVRLVGPRESRALNARYRNRDKPTNVLSFPAAAPGNRRGPAGLVPAPLGDLVICPTVLRTEAREQRKPLRAHWAHLVVHGALHLVGYRHERSVDARRMERREIAVLKRLGFPNPYRTA